MHRINFQQAIIILQEQFPRLDWHPTETAVGGQTELIYHWPGTCREDILICCHQSEFEREPFHRHDFFYFNYTYQGQYNSISCKYDRKITIRENELYAGQPFAGHALFAHDPEKTMIIGILIRKEAFFSSFLSALSGEPSLFHFFLNPLTNQVSEEYLHLYLNDNQEIRTLLEMMAVEYASSREDSQELLRALVSAFLIQIARQYGAQLSEKPPVRLADKFLQYMNRHSDSVTLKELSEQFSYHPNYISAVLNKEFGIPFSRLLLQMRMERALALMRGTSLPLEQIASMVGYSNNSNFYKAFRNYFHASPREYLARLTP